MRWLPAAYRKNPSRVAELMSENINLATDEAPATALRRVVRRLATYWQRRFDDAAKELAAYFATKTAERTTHALQSTLRRGGFSVRFKLSTPLRDALRASINENVGPSHSSTSRRWRAT